MAGSGWFTHVSPLLIHRQAPLIANNDLAPDQGNDLRQIWNRSHSCIHMTYGLTVSDETQTSGGAFQIIRMGVQKKSAIVTPFRYHDVAKQQR
jgi:hypothetical protein